MTASAIRFGRASARHWFLAAYVFLCLLVTADEALSAWRGLNLSAASWAGEFWSLMMLAMWVEADSREHAHSIYRPYDFGFLTFMFWLPYLPYYFWRTRGAIGLWACAAMAELQLVGKLAAVLIYITR